MWSLFYKPIKSRICKVPNQQIIEISKILEKISTLKGEKKKQKNPDGIPILKTVVDGDAGFNWLTFYSLNPD